MPSTRAAGDSEEDTAARLHADVDRTAGPLHVLHAARLQCRAGCAACCVDDLTVFEAEAEQIRQNHGELLARGVPAKEGACAFLDDAGRCRIYGDRPYVCRTQGLPLRWIEGAVDGASAIELRDICPLNEAGAPIELLASEECWTLGPIEERLGRMQVASGGGARRTRLRDLFVGASHGHAAGAGPSSTHLEPKRVISMGDKSPKAKDKSKKQQTNDKNQKQTAATAKAKSSGSPAATKKGK